MDDSNIDSLDEPEATEMAELILKATAWLTEGMIQHDDKIAMLAFISLLRDFTMAIEKNYSEIESNNGTIDINLN